MRNVVVTHSGVELEGAMETFLFGQLAALEAQCDSVQSWRVHLQGRPSSSGRTQQFCVRLLLSTSEHHIAINTFNATHGAFTARDAIRAAIDEAHNELRDLKLTRKCTTCSSR